MDVSNVYCYCCLIVLFFLPCFLNNDISHQFNAAFWLHWVICSGGNLCSDNFFEKILEFLRFFICSSFGRHLIQKWEWAGSELYVRTHITDFPCFQHLCWEVVVTTWKYFPLNMIFSWEYRNTFSWQVTYWS